MWSSRSRNIGSPHWMSSKTTASGRSRATSSSCVRTAQKSSFGGGSAFDELLERGVGARAELLQYRDDRPEGDAFAVVEAAAVQDGRVDAGQELRGKVVTSRRLPRPGG